MAGFQSALKGLVALKLEERAQPNPQFHTENLKSFISLGRQQRQLLQTFYFDTYSSADYSYFN